MKMTNWMTRLYLSKSNLLFGLAGSILANSLILIAGIGVGRIALQID